MDSPAFFRQFAAGMVENDQGDGAEPVFADVSPLAGRQRGPGFEALDRRVIGLWRLSRLIGTAIFTMVPAAISSAAVFVNARAWTLPALGGWGVIASGLLALQYWYAGRAYDAWGYRLDDRVLEIRTGVWFRSLTLLPLSRLQHVDLTRGPLERVFGLASLVVHTAGTHEATILIPGLDARAAAQLRERLLAAGGDDAV